jgi:NADH-quinone oxidoreductase subunit L
LAITSLLTAIYMFRLYYMVFKGSYRGGAHAHESPPVMTWPLFLLTSFTLVGGLFAMPEWFRHYADAAVHAISRSFKALENNVDAFLTPSLKVSGTNLYFEHFGGAVELAFVGFSILVAVAGWLVARRLYGGGDGKSTVDLMGKTGTLGRAVAAKWYVDEIIEAAVIRPYWALSRQAFAKVDGAVIEKGLIGGSAKSVEIGGILLRAWQNGNAQRYLAAILITAAALLYAMVK